jgi:hypothetical protein
VANGLLPRHISWMEKLLALTFVAAIVVFAAAYALSAWKGRHP